MNKTLAITVIALVAVVMGMSVVAPVMAHDVTEQKTPSGSKTCPEGFDIVLRAGQPGIHPDHNMNFIVCSNGHVEIDDLPCEAIRGECSPGTGK